MRYKKVNLIKTMKKCYERDATKKILAKFYIERLYDKIVINKENAMHYINSIYINSQKIYYIDFDHKWIKNKNGDVILLPSIGIYLRTKKTNTKNHNYYMFNCLKIQGGYITVISEKTRRFCQYFEKVFIPKLEKI
jgi:hypothetical protein